MTSISDDETDAFAPEALSADAFLGGRLVLRQPVKGYRAGVDPVLLAAAVPARPGETVLELGCGAGTALFCLGARIEGLALHGVELQPAYAALARENARSGGIRAEIHTADIGDLPAEVRTMSFDHVLANPPFFPAASGTSARDPGRAAALAETRPLGDWVRVALRRLRPGGTLTLIQSADRLPDLLTAFGRRDGSVTVLPVVSRCGRPAKRVIVRATKGGRAPFRLLSPLVMHAGAAHVQGQDDYTPEVRAVLRDAQRIDAFPR